MFRLNTMSSSKKITFLLLIIFIMALWPKGAAALEKMTLKAAVAQALVNNHEMMALKNSLAANKEDIGIAQSNL
ncbi:MAG: hypothetical protein ACWGOD_08210, partial [Desulfobulbales bacterium]